MNTQFDLFFYNLKSKNLQNDLTIIKSAVKDLNNTGKCFLVNFQFSHTKISSRLARKYFNNIFCPKISFS